MTARGGFALGFAAGAAYSVVVFVGFRLKRWFLA